ncbi:cell division-like protein kinase 2 [Perkinsela sp. CCAP 1560/4]|nr:cell division-like protein kinase 2 [Perkinsela sp. CCAP 1560/4]|eukprot:KNH03808.1 cell division-like protein kinase 2 [Perkinsela sp. CCAP 1560/4]
MKSARDVSSTNFGSVAPREVTERFQTMEVLGEGTYGVVYRAVDRATGEVVALKKIRLDYSDDGIPQTALREVSILQELHHPNVVALRDVICVQDSKLFLVFEYVEKDIKQVIEHSLASYTPLMLKRLMFQMLEGLAYCHSNRVIHRDLKPANILLSDKNQLKLADFGLARAFQIPTSTFTHEVVTLWYRAPEILLGEKHYCPAVDIWSVGCIIAELMRKKVLFRGDSEIGQLYEIFRVLGTPSEGEWIGVSALPDFKNVFPRWRKAPLHEIIPGIDLRGIDLLERMLVYEPLDRISAKQALAHSYFDEIRNI